MLINRLISEMLEFFNILVKSTFFFQRWHSTGLNRQVKCLFSLQKDGTETQAY